MDLGLDWPKTAMHWDGNLPILGFTDPEFKLVAANTF